MVKAMDCGILVSEFATPVVLLRLLLEMTAGKGMNPFIPPPTDLGLNSIIAVFYMDGIGII